MSDHQTDNNKPDSNRPDASATRPWDLSAHQAPAQARHIDPEDLSLYAMQLLSGEEAATVAHHLEACGECRREIARVQGDLAAYALTVEIHSPAAAVRQRLVRQVSRERKVIPITQAQPPIASFGRNGGLLAAESTEDVQPRRRVGPAILGWSGWAVAAGLAVAATFLYKDRESLRGTLASQSGQVAHLSAEAAQAHVLMDALTDPKAVRVSLTSKPLLKAAPAGGATYNADKGSLVFLASNLDPLQPYKTYELWVIPADGHDPIPAGTFHPDAQGNASVIMPDLPKGVAAKGFGVTIEDEGGSAIPTKPLILAG